MNAKAVGHRKWHMCGMMVMGAKVATLLFQLAFHRSLVGPAWHVPQRPRNSDPRSMAWATGHSHLSNAAIRHKSSRRLSQSPWLRAQVMMQHYVAGLGPGAPFGFNTKTPARLQNVAPRRLPVKTDRPVTPEAHGSALLSAEEERLQWLDAHLSKLNARRAKVIADESRLHQQFKELAELRGVGDNVL